jgi:hypothetical protein
MQSYALQLRPLKPPYATTVAMPTIRNLSLEHNLYLHSVNPVQPPLHPSVDTVTAFFFLFSLLIPPLAAAPLRNAMFFFSSLSLSLSPSLSVISGLVATPPIDFYYTQQSSQVFIGEHVRNGLG